MQHESAKWRPSDADDDAPTQQPMAAGLKPAQRKAPTADQKKVRREMQRSAATEDSPVGKFMSADGLQHFLDKEDHSSPAKDWDMAPGTSMTPGPNSVSSQMSDSSVGAASAPSGASTSSGSAGSATAAQHTAEYQYVKKRGDKWVILQKGTGKVLSEHDSEEKAKASFRAMMQSKHGSGQTKICSHCGWHRDRCEALPAGAQCCTNCEHGKGSKHSSQHTADITNAGDRECQACGYHGSPTLGDTGPVCSRCGSYSLLRSPYKAAGVSDAPSYQHRSAGDYMRTAGQVPMQREATQLETNVASADGRVLLNAGDNIRMPNGLTVQVKNVRRHETSLDHYYVDTDAGTTVVPYSTKFQVVPSNSRQLSLPDYGTPGGNFNYLPGNPQHAESTNVVGHDEECPSCGRKGTLSMHDGKYACSVCGYSSTRRGENEFTDATQVIKNWSSRKTPTTAIAKRAAQVLANTEGDTL